MEQYSYDLVVVGGGLSGMCAAISAARLGTKTALIHNRPVVGGNASSEMRMHICGADDHMSRPNARETGIIEEIQLEHKARNIGNSYAVFDSILWEKVAFQENLTLYLNTHMTDVKTQNGKIISVKAIGLTNEKEYCFTAPLFVDATGDGSLGANAGADYTVGRESKKTYGEGYAPDKADHYTMGNSVMFRAKDMGKPIPFVKPFWANEYTEDQLSKRDHQIISSGYWWIELGGGQQNTISDAENIRDDLLPCVYGIWDHIKNGGDHGADNYDLEWVGFLPGKRESRRFLGDYVLNENDCRNGTQFDDAVAYGGWPMDVHTVEGFRNENDDPTVWIHLDDVYTIPYRCLYSRNIDNLFLAGRIISCSHMAFASTRVMATCAVVGEAVGVAACIASNNNISPRETGKYIKQIQQQLLKNDCYIPGISNSDDKDFARNSKVSASGSLKEYSSQNVINGVSRTVGNQSNCWKELLNRSPWLCLEFDETKNISELYIAFDSNLSREITISINDDVLSRQSECSPPELVKDYTVDFISNNEKVHTLCINNNYQRHSNIKLKQSVICDKIVINILDTHGCESATIFEVRAY